MTPIANPISLIEGETSLPFADCEPAVEVCACDESRALRAELVVVKAQRDYLVQFADPKELRQMEVELAAENAPPRRCYPALRPQVRGFSPVPQVRVGPGERSPGVIRCRATPCREPGHLGSLAFCAAHFMRLTPLKRSKVEALRSLNAVDPAARVIINQVVLECRQYLLAHHKEERKHANG